MEHQNTEKLSLIIDLINLSRSDNNFGPEEEKFINIIVHQIGVTREELETLKSAKIEYRAPRSEFDRILHIHRLILLMCIDRNINKEEKEFVRETGLRIGLRPQATEEVLERLADYPNYLIPPKVLINIFRKYHN